MTYNKLSQSERQPRYITGFTKWPSTAGFSDDVTWRAVRGSRSTIDPSNGIAPSSPWRLGNCSGKLIHNSLTEYGCSILYVWENKGIQLFRQNSATAIWKFGNLIHGRVVAILSLICCERTQFVAFFVFEKNMVTLKGYIGNTLCKLYACGMHMIQVFK